MQLKCILFGHEWEEIYEVPFTGTQIRSCERCPRIEEKRLGQNKWNEVIWLNARLLIGELEAVQEKLAKEAVAQ